MTRTGRHAAPARPSPAAPATARPRRRPNRVLEVAALLSPLAAAAALAWSLRGAPLGTPVADDFEFLRRVAFGDPDGLFGSMGASWYWRPLARQAWFALVSPLLLASPGVVAAFHAALTGAIAFVLARLAGRVAPRPAAALVAAAALATEPVRVLLAWPSGSQHLLAVLALALTAHETLAGRRWTAAFAALAAALSHDLGAFAFLVLGAGGLVRREGRAAWRDAALGAGLAALWAGGYAFAIARGVRLSAGGLAMDPAAWLEALRLGVGAAFNLETLPAAWAGPAGTLAAALFAAGLATLVGTARGPRLGGAAAMVGVALAIAWLGLVPLAELLPDWNAWRAYVPALALAFAVTLACARAHLALGLAFVALRVATLAAAEPAPPVRGDPPPAVSDLSFARVARMQKVVAATGEVVRAAGLPRGARVAYLALPEMTMNGLRGSAALQVWTRDSIARFVPFEGDDARPDGAALVVSYDLRPGRALAVPLSAEARRLWARAAAAADSLRLEESRDLYRAAMAAQRPESPTLSANALQNLALQAIHAGRYGEADSLNRAARAVRGVTPEIVAIDALLALRRGDVRGARRLAAAALRIGPGNVLAVAVADEVRRAGASANAAGGPAP